MLRVEGLVSGYGRTQVLRGLSLTVLDREIVAVLGPNGAGKSTLIKTISGSVNAWSGTIEFDAVPLIGRRPDEVAHLGLAVVPEGRHIFSLLSVRENLLLAAGPGRKKALLNDDLDFVLTTFPDLKKRWHAGGAQLSGGQQQMLALARAIMQRPRLILMDEPTIGLSPLVVEQLPGFIRAAYERTCAAVLLVEQDVGVALDLASRCYVLRSGRVVHEAAPDQLRDSAALASIYLGGKM